MTGTTEPGFDRVDENDLRIKEMIANIDLKLLDATRRRQEIAWSPWQIVLTVFGASAAFFAAGATVFKLLIG